MIYTVIPFLLAANISTITDTARFEKYGPEFKYSVNARISADYANTGKNYMTYNMSMRLVCWPSTPIDRVCQMSNAKWSSSLSRGVKTIPSQKIGMKFQESGVVMMTIEQAENEALTEILKKTVSLFHVGADLRYYTEQTFKTRENFTIGDCHDTQFEAIWFPVEDTGSRKNYDLKMLIPGDRKDADFVLLKIRNADKCNTRKLYFSYLHHHVTGKELISSLAWMNVTRANEFESYTSMTAKYTAQGNDYILRETVTVTLDDIGAAKRRVPYINVTDTTEVIKNGQLFTIDRVHPLVDPE